MLLNFSVANYRSVDKAVELDLRAINAYKEHGGELLSMSAPGTKGMRLLRSVALYGPNASGKSTILRAIGDLRWMVVGPPPAADASLPFEPFALDRESGSPTTFSVSFVTTTGEADRVTEEGSSAPGGSAAKEGTSDAVHGSAAGGPARVASCRFDYEVSFNERAIVAETLSSYPKGRRQVWISRSYDSHAGTLVHKGGRLRLGRELLGLLNDNQTCLSLIAQHPNYKGTAVAAPVVEWFRRLSVLMTASGSHGNAGPVTDILAGRKGSDRERAMVRTLMRVADFGIQELSIKRREYAQDEIAQINRLGELLYPGVSLEVVEGEERAWFSHVMEDKSVDLPRELESDGTDKLFCLSGWIIPALETGGVLFVDELDASLHPALLLAVLRLFLDPGTNPQGAQLVLTAQNTLLMGRDPDTGEPILRRDQIWLTDKGADGRTRLYPLSDYAPRGEESIQLRYLVGRYAATPYLDDFDRVMSQGWKEA